MNKTFIFDNQIQSIFSIEKYFYFHIFFSKNRVFFRVAWFCDDVRSVWVNLVGFCVYSAQISKDFHWFSTIHLVFDSIQLVLHQFSWFQSIQLVFASIQLVLNQFSKLLLQFFKIPEMRPRQWHIKWHFYQKIVMLKISLLSQFPAYFLLSSFRSFPLAPHCGMSLPHLFPVFRGQWTHINFLFFVDVSIQFWLAIFFYFSIRSTFFSSNLNVNFVVILFSGKKWEQANKYEREQLFVAIGTSFALTLFNASIFVQSHLVSIASWLLLLTEMKWNACDILSISLFFFCTKFSLFFFGSSLHVSRKTF